MEITIDITKEDYVYFSKFYNFHRKKKRNLISAFYFLLFTIGIDVAPILIARKDFELKDFGTTSIFLFALLVWYMSTFWTIHSKVTKMLQASPHLLGKKLIRFDTDGIHGSDEMSESHLKWESFLEFVETPSHFILYNTTMTGMLLPKRCIEQEPQIEKIQKELRAKSEELHIPYLHFS